jgi:hypothetical protein
VELHPSARGRVLPAPHVPAHDLVPLSDHALLCFFVPSSGVDVISDRERASLSSGCCCPLLIDGSEAAWSSRSCGKVVDMVVKRELNGRAAGVKALPTMNGLLLGVC